MRRIIQTVETVAGLFLAAVVLITLVSVVLRYIFNSSLPDGYDFASLLLGIAVLWGLAPAARYNAHIKVDSLWSALKPRGRRLVDIVSGAITLVFLAAMAIMLVLQALDSWRAGLATSEVRFAVWPFHALAVAGAVAAAPLALLWLVRAARGETSAPQLPGGGTTDAPSSDEHV